MHVYRQFLYKMPQKLLDKEILFNFSIFKYLFHINIHIFTHN